MKIAVVGCGMAGPVCALFLKRAGHTVEIFEQAPQLGPIGAGILLQPTGLSVLKRLGILEEVRRHGGTVRRLIGWTPAGERILHLPYEALGDGATGLGIHRGTLFSILRTHVDKEQVPIHAAHEVRKIAKTDSGRVRLSFAHGTEAGPYDLVVIADGANARAQWDGADRATEPQQWGAWWMSLPDAQGLFPETLHQIYSGSRRLLGVLPTGAAREGAVPSVSLFWGIRLDEAHAWREQGIPACRRQMLELEPRLAPVLEHLTDSAQMTLARYFDRLPERWSEGRLVLAGDAAHAMSPHLGQGTNLAFLDAAALADALAEHENVEEALIHYRNARYFHARMYGRFSRIMMPFFQSDAQFGAKLRDLFLPAGCRIPFLQRRMLRVLRGEVRGWSDLLVL